MACLRAVWVEWAAWAAWITKPTGYSLTEAINHSRVSQEARLFCLAGIFVLAPGSIWEV